MKRRFSRCAKRLRCSLFKSEPAKLTPKGYEEIDRAAIVAPTNKDAGRKTVWVHPAFAGKKMYVRNDIELVCVDLAK